MLSSWNPKCPARFRTTRSSRGIAFLSGHCQARRLPARIALGEWPNPIGSRRRAHLGGAETAYTDSMAIDERLEAALTHSVELWSHMHMDAGKEYEERFRANDQHLAQLMDTMNRLGRILEIHDQHI
jgi:hypothetical protein